MASVKHVLVKIARLLCHSWRMIEDILPSVKVIFKHTLLLCHKIPDTPLY